VDVIKVAVAAMILDRQANVWLMRRTMACRDEHGCWSPVTGLAEPGETIEDSMRRELKEEVGLDAGDDLEFLGYRDLFREGSPQLLGMDFLIRADRDQVRICEPVNFDRAGWFPRYGLPVPLDAFGLDWIKKYGHLIRAI
jgi:ADP-ribose pyrophosphatase YjhB (NUDIX family)